MLPSVPFVFKIHQNLILPFTIVDNVTDVKALKKPHIFQTKQKTMS